MSSKQNIKLARPRGNPSGKETFIHGHSVHEIARGVRVHDSTISRIFNGTRSVSLKRAWDVARYLGIPLEQLAKDLYEPTAKK
jgi:transcriptional regulator with XRE-family HTH domain